MDLLTAALLVVTVRTYDSYGVPARDLQTAIRVASTALAAAGVATKWIDCDTAGDRCGAVAERSAIIVRISRGPGGRDGGDALGTAAVDMSVKQGSLATLYFDRVVAHASAAGADPGTLLGRAAAHEIGHLLMGTTAHAPHGLMRGRWSRTDLQRRFERDWLFSAPEADWMRRQVAARAKTAPTSSDLVVASAALGPQDGR